VAGANVMQIVEQLSPNMRLPEGTDEAQFDSVDEDMSSLPLHPDVDAAFAAAVTIQYQAEERELTPELQL
jgi:hypothetical protein